MNHSMAENFMRSAKAPAISAGVMMAKVIWKQHEDRLGNGHRQRVRIADAGRDVAHDALQEGAASPPMYGEPGVKARL